MTAHPVPMPSSNGQPAIDRVEPEQHAPQEHAAPGVLVVEHDPGQRAALERALYERGWAVLSAADAPAALYLLERLPIDEQPAAILLNLLLPIMTGQQFVYEYHRLPVPHAPIFTLGPPLGSSGAAAVPGQVETLLDSLRQLGDAK